MRYVTEKETINNEILNNKPGLFFKEHHKIEEKNFSSINMLNGNKTYGRTNFLNKFLSRDHNGAINYSAMKDFNRLDKFKTNDLIVNYNNINEHNKQKLAESFAQSNFLLGGCSNIDIRKLKVLERSYANEKKIEMINDKFFKSNGPVTKK